MTAITLWGEEVLCCDLQKSTGDKETNGASATLSWEENKAENGAQAPQWL